MWTQKSITLAIKPRGFHLITDEILQAIPEISQIKTGIAYLFIQHSSASLSINEDADPQVRADLESHFNEFVPENRPYYTHRLEGLDDMPAHIKTTLIGTSLTLPIANGKLMLGTWQGIHLGEHRNEATARTVIITLSGDR